MTANLKKYPEPTWMCENVEMWISTNRALAAKKCGSEHLAAIFCPSLLHLLPLSSPPLKFPYGMFHFCDPKGTCQILCKGTKKISNIQIVRVYFGRNMEEKCNF